MTQREGRAPDASMTSRTIAYVVIDQDLTGKIRPIESYQAR
jgi:hypothetical protein